MRRLTTVRTSVEATLLQHVLEMEGIESFVTNEHSGTLLPHLFGMLGHGIQVMVTEDDYEMAKALLIRKQKEYETGRCPKCGSPNIAFGMKGKRRRGERLLIWLSLIVAIPMGNIRNKYYCKDCGVDFE